MVGANFQRLVALAEERAIPLSVHLELTGRCPLHCGHCYLAPSLSPEELTTAQWENVIEQLADLGTLFLTFTGGEVFLRPDVLHQVAFARARGMGVSLLTSGVCLTEPALDQLARFSPLNVGISIYSARSSVHDQITGYPGAHARSVAAVRGLIERRVPVTIRSPILQANVDQLDEVIALARDLGADYTFDPIVIVRRDGNLGPQAFRPSGAALARALSRPPFREQMAITQGLRPSSEQGICAAGRRIATILPNGDLMACSLYPEAAGNVTRKPLAEIWAHSPVLRALREVKQRDLHFPCGSCSQMGHCGRCGALALLEDGDFLGPSRVACELAEARELVVGAAPAVAAEFSPCVEPTPGGGF